MIRVYRVCRAIYARLDGEGARRAGGRWNSPGRAVVYMAESISLAVLENLVHLSKEDFPAGYVTVAAAIPESLPVAKTGERGREREIGDRWIDSDESAVMRVSSVVVPSEHLYLLNPSHPDFSRISVERMEPFVFDPRLFRW